MDDVMCGGRSMQLHVAIEPQNHLPLAQMPNALDCAEKRKIGRKAATFVVHPLTCLPSPSEMVCGTTETLTKKRHVLPPHHFAPE